jgi:hypothetical protein
MTSAPIPFQKPVCRSHEAGSEDLAVFLLAKQVTTRLPVRSALSKQRTGESVFRLVASSEYLLLYVFANFASF